MQSKQTSANGSLLTIVAVEQFPLATSMPWILLQHVLKESNEINR